MNISFVAMISDHSDGSDSESTIASFAQSIGYSFSCSPARIHNLC